jgi:hypothetical protein
MRFLFMLFFIVNCCWRNTESGPVLSYAKLIVSIKPKIYLDVKMYLLMVSWDGKDISTLRLAPLPSVLEGFPCGDAL